VLSHKAHLFKVENGCYAILFAFRPSIFKISGVWATSLVLAGLLHTAEFKFGVLVICSSNDDMSNFFFAYLCHQLLAKL